MKNGEGIYVGILLSCVGKSNLMNYDRRIPKDHYKTLKIQPTEFIHENNIPFIEGNVIKYVCRHRNKNGKEDLLKAIDYLNKLIELEYPEIPFHTVVENTLKWTDTTTG
jgi:hypothetical protein